MIRRDKRMTSVSSPVPNLAVSAAISSAYRQRRIADGVAEVEQFRDQPARLLVAPIDDEREHLSGYADRQRRLVAGGGRQFVQFVEAGVVDASTDAPGADAEQGPGRDPHRGPADRVAWQLVGDVAGTLPGRSRRVHVAAGQPGCGAHVPPERLGQVTGELQMLGDQRRVLLSQRRVALRDRRGHPPVQRGAARLELRPIGHRADQRLVKRVLLDRCEHHLIDKLGLHQPG